MASAFDIAGSGEVPVRSQSDVSSEEVITSASARNRASLVPLRAPMVHSAGWVLLCQAAFSAGMPKASHPMGAENPHACLFKVVRQ
jgi:hypothetical protein